MVRHLSVKEVLRIHFRVIETYGGSHKVRDLGLLESALARPKSGFGDYEAYPDLFDKAAVLLHSLVKNHPFIDGNKRTALSVVTLFLKRNRFDLAQMGSEMVEFVVSVAEGTTAEDEIAAWLKAHSQKV